MTTVSAPSSASPRTVTPGSVQGKAQRVPLLLRPKVQQIVYPLLVLVLLLGAWQGAVDAFKLPSYLVPSPIEIFKTLGTDAGTLLPALWSTLKITLLSFGASIVVGVLISFVFVQSRLIELALLPYAVLLQVTPIVAVAPLIIIWVKDPTLSLVICSALVAVFPIISNTTLGLRSVDPDLLAYFRMKRASRWQQLVRLRVPGALPYFFGGLRISSGLALIGAVVAEFVAGAGGSGAGLAYEILQAGYQLNIPRMFAALLLISLTGVLLFAVMGLVARWALGSWHSSAQAQD
jgi:NitT/TauT family transport system permease protein